MRVPRNVGPDVLWNASPAPLNGYCTFPGALMMDVSPLAGALEALAANGVDVMVDAKNGYTLTPVIARDP
jgi:hypothetical protein